MLRTRVIQTVAAGLIAAGALACFGAATGGGSVGDASAQGACAEWQVTVFVEDCRDTVCDVPAGWEPISAHNNYYDGLWLRRCAP